jgi:hypothetical protein
LLKSIALYRTERAKRKTTEICEAENNSDSIEVCVCVCLSEVVTVCVSLFCAIDTVCVWFSLFYVINSGSTMSWGQTWEFLSTLRPDFDAGCAAGPTTRLVGCPSHDVQHRTFEGKEENIEKGSRRTTQAGGRL